jgi:hypothetical protein
MLVVSVKAGTHHGNDIFVFYATTFIARPFHLQE